MYNDEFRDPRTHPRPGDTVEVDFGEGEKERRTVVRNERKSGGQWVVHCYINGDAAHTHAIRLRDWQEVADDSVVIDRGIPA